MRNYEAPEFAQRDTREYVPLRVAQADTNVRGPLQAGDPTWRDRMLAGLLGKGADTMEKLHTLSLQQAYLEGAAQAGVAESEEALEGEGLTKDWRVAGYRDTMGKLAIADAGAKFQADIGMLREREPGEFEEYLSTRRGELMPTLAGMSLEARAGAMQQLLALDRADTAKWTSERIKFIMDTKRAGVIKPWSAGVHTLQAAAGQVAAGQMSEQAYAEQVSATADMLLTNVWGDKSFPTPVKQQLTGSMLELALDRDAVAVYDLIANTPLQDGDGKSTLLSRLDQETQSKLSGKYREAMQRTSAVRTMMREEQLQRLEVDIEQGTGGITYTGLTSALRPMVINGEVTRERFGSLIGKYLTKRAKTDMASQLYDAGLRGDVDFALRNGKSINDIIDATDTMLASTKATPEARLRTWLNVGVNGIDKGFQKAGEFLDVTLSRAALAPTDKMDPKHEEVFNTVRDAIRTAEDKGLTNTRARLLSGVNESNRMFAERVLTLTSGSGAVPLSAAITAARDAQAKEDSLSPAVKAAQATQASAGVTSLVNSLEPVGLLGALWDHTKAMFGSKDAASELAITPRSTMGARDQWFGHSETVQFYAEQARQELLDEANIELLKRGNSTDPKSIVSVAKANLAARTIQVDNSKAGPLYMPRGSDTASIFGVGRGNTADIGKAISDLLPEPVQDGRWRLRFEQGQLRADEFTSGGMPVRGFYIAPAQITERIKERMATQQLQADLVHGAGRTVTKDGVSVRYNGDTSTGLPESWMFALRENLVKNEGIHTGVQNDLSGKLGKDGTPVQVVGVGITSQNTYFPKLKDGKITSEQATESFKKASDEAARAGFRAAQQAGRATQHGVVLLSEVAYQSGGEFANRQDSVGVAYRAFLSELGGTNISRAKEAFQRTPAYTSSGSSRRDHYMALIERTMKGR